MVGDQVYVVSEDNPCLWLTPRVDGNLVYRSIWSLSVSES